MRCICAGMMMFLLIFICVQSAKASEAQAAFMGSALDSGYDIPDHLSGEEKKWFKVFQEGNMLAAGWQKITADILASAPVDEHPAQRIALENLGLKIGQEWSRPNDVRKVDSSMLREWGNILKKTARENPQQLTSAIAYIDRQVDDLLD
jgi:hypothetical protein